MLGALRKNPRSKWFCSGTGCGYFSNQGSTTEASDVAVVPADYTLGTAPRELYSPRAPGTRDLELIWHETTPRRVTLARS